MNKNKKSILLSHVETNRNLLVSFKEKNMKIDYFFGSKKPFLGWYSHHMIK